MNYKVVWKPPSEESKHNCLEFIPKAGSIEFDTIVRCGVCGQHWVAKHGDWNDYWAKSLRFWLHRGTTGG